MIPELGHAALCLAIALAALQCTLPLLERLFEKNTIRYLCKPIATVVFMLLTTSFVALIHSYAVSDFTVYNVILNSHTLKPLLYKITGTWGNHEGSMLLWVWVLSLFGFLIALTRETDTGLKATTLAVHGFITLGFLLFILLTSNPFIRVFPPPENGEDLNPLLQDIGLAMHPPMLYIGYVGFGIVFAYAVAGMLCGRIDSAWATTVHPWILLTWGTLTAGIGLGSWWAYRELGWGGWWFWDPVENVSLLPWFAGGALMHANLILQKRGACARWVALLAILTFTMSLMGTFIVRSGLITSVHSFASDPTRGMFILGYVAFICMVGFVVYARFEPQQPHQPLGARSAFILGNNVLMVSITASILLAILYPLFLSLAGMPSISVGAPYFNSVIVPLCAPLLLLAGVAMLLPWNAATPNLGVLRLLLILACGAALLAYALLAHDALLGAGCAFIATWLLVACVQYSQKLWRAAPTWKQIPLRSVGSVLAHAGLAIFVVGVGATSLFKTTYEAPMRDGETAMFGDYALTLQSLKRAPQDNYMAQRATLALKQQGKHLVTLVPETRFYPVRAQETSESALNSTPWRDIYAVIGRANVNAKADASHHIVGVRLYIVPGQNWIWLGFALAALGSMLAAGAALRHHSSRMKV